MPAELPNRATSGSRGADAFNRLRENSRSHQPSGAPGTLVSHTVHGIFHEIDSPLSYSGEAATEFPFQVYRSDPDYLRIMLTPGWIVTTGDPFEPANMRDYIGLAENSIYRVYLEVTSTAATIVASTTIQTVSVNRIFVAKVVTTLTTEPLTITQILRENPQIPCA